MIGQCANPECGRELRYLRSGKIYLFEVSAKTGGRRREHFWLCGECSDRMALICVNQSEVRAVHRLQVCAQQACQNRNAEPESSNQTGAECHQMKTIWHVTQF